MQLNQLGHLGMDECFGATHLAEPAFGTVPETKWDINIEALPGGIAITVSDTDDADLAAFFAASDGELYVAKGSAIAVDDVFTVGGTGDTNDDALEAAKGTTIVDGDVFKVTGIGGSEAVVFLISDLSGPNGNIQINLTNDADANLTAFFAGGLKTAKTSSGNTAIAVGDIFTVGDTDDTANDDLEAAKTSTPVANDIFVVTDIGSPAITFVGNKVAVYAFSHDQISKLSQTAANRAIVGVAMRAYIYTYTVVQYVEPDETIFTLEGFGNSIVLPHSAGVAKELIFAAPAGAEAADFEIRSTSDGATQGIITFDDQILRGIIKQGVTPGKTDPDIKFSGIHGAIQAIGAAATVSATGKSDTGLTSIAIAEGDIIYGRFTEIRPTAGIIAAYRVKDN